MDNSASLSAQQQRSSTTAAGNTTTPLSAEDLAQFESLDFGSTSSKPFTGGGGGGGGGAAGQGPWFSAPVSGGQGDAYGSYAPPAQPQPQEQQQRQQQPQSQPREQNYSSAYDPHSSSTFTTNGIVNPHAPANPYNPFLNMGTANSQLVQGGREGEEERIEPNPGTPASASNPFMNPISSIPTAPSGTTYPPPSSQPLSAAFPTPYQGTTDAAASGSGAQSTPAPPQEDKAWPTKDIIFRGRDRKIVMQNENGPCSLIAIANILLLRGDVELQPPDRPLVNYDYLSSLIAEYLLSKPGDASLEQALTLLPQTQYGLNLNPGFISNETFYTSAEGNDERRPSQLALFDLLGIKLYHGFLPDPSSPDTYELLISHRSYDSAVDQVVRGDAIADQFFTEAMGESGVPAPLKVLKERGGIVLLESKGWGTALQRKNLAAAIDISTFLDSNASQLTYPGLFSLSALPEGTLCALFRSNHLSVLYRPVSSDLPPPREGELDRSPPTLLTLLTADAFLDEELAVWESLADVDGSGSGEIYDGRFRRRVIDQSRHLPVSGRSGGNTGGRPDGNGDAEVDADYALALQLHVEENERLERARERRASRQLAGTGTTSSQTRRPFSFSGGNARPSNENGRPATAGKKSGGGGFLSAFGKKGKKGQQQQQQQQQQEYRSQQQSEGQYEPPSFPPPLSATSPPPASASAGAGHALQGGRETTLATPAQDGADRGYEGYEDIGRRPPSRRQDGEMEGGVTTAAAGGSSSKKKGCIIM